MTNTTTPFKRSFKRVMIANRGEIACRVMRTLKALDIESVAVYSEADRNAQHVHLADHAIAIGASEASESYLNMQRIIDAAKLSGANAIHPGYGFLSENPDFARLCVENDIVLIGPPAEAMSAMGSKAQAKAIMDEAGVSLVPGYHGDNQDVAFLQQQVNDIGYPVLLKASYGGGGKGMRKVFRESELKDAIDGCKREARASFGNDHLIVEKLIVNPRHVEIQVFADQHGNAVYLFERDCSIQRRHQKVVEEAPAPGLDQELRQRMGEAAVRAARAIGYVGAGTVEFLLDQSGDFYFMEMNTRLQVEHPVTEMITGQDLVAWQVRVAEGHPLPLQQQQLTLRGHSIEVRIYAEDPQNEFLPCTGRIERLQLPEISPHLRVDSGVVSGDEISVFYDPMIAKLIVWDEDRARAIHRLQSALKAFHIVGLKTNIPFLSRIVKHQGFTHEIPGTGFIEQFQDDLLVKSADIQMQDYAAVALFQLLDQQQAPAQAGDPWHGLSGWQLNDVNRTEYHYVQGEETVTVELQQSGSAFRIKAGAEVLNLNAVLDGHRLRLSGDAVKSVSVYPDSAGFALLDEGQVKQIQPKALHWESQAQGSDSQLTAPMNGRLVKVLVAAGDEVQPEDPLLIVEAMKMEHTIRAHKAGTVLDILYAEGDLVSEGAQLIELQLKEEETQA